jgi:hypothetical protein
MQTPGLHMMHSSARGGTFVFLCWISLCTRGRSLPIDNGASRRQGVITPPGSVSAGNPVIVPEPAEWKHGNLRLSIFDASDFKFLTAVPPGPELRDAFSRYRGIMFPHNAGVQDHPHILQQDAHTLSAYFPPVAPSCALAGVQLWVEENDAPLEVSLAFASHLSDDSPRRRTWCMAARMASYSFVFMILVVALQNHLLCSAMTAPSSG